MKFSYEWFIIVALVMLSLCLSDSLSSDKTLESRNSSQNNVRGTLKTEPRPRRQKPFKKKKSAAGLLRLFGSLVKDTLNDTRVAYKNISRLVEDSLSPPTTTPGEGVTSSDNMTTPMPLSRQQVFDLLGRNYRGLRKLWDTEMKLAVSDSRKNIRKFQKDLRESIRPFLLTTTDSPNNVT